MEFLPKNTVYFRVTPPLEESLDGNVSSLYVGSIYIPSV